jgi:hypothetical protein
MIVLWTFYRLQPISHLPLCSVALCVAALCCRLSLCIPFSLSIAVTAMEPLLGGSRRKRVGRVASVKSTVLLHRQCAAGARSD